MWVCPRKEECKWHKDVTDKSDDYCNGMKPYDPRCDRFEPKRKQQEVDDGPEKKFYTLIENANPGYLVFFDGLDDGWYIAFGKTALKLKREFGYKDNRRGGAGVGKSNWKTAKQKYLAKGYGILLMRGNVPKEKIAPPDSDS